MRLFINFDLKLDMNDKNNHKKDEQTRIDLSLNVYQIDDQ